MWIFYALSAAFFAGITSLFTKAGVKNVNSTLATAIRTIIILFFSIIVVIVIGSFNEISKLDFKTIVYLILSGITTALLWMSYFKALELGDINKVTPVDKTSIILTLILSSIFLKEKITIIKIISMILIMIGTFLMVTKHKCEEKDNNKWFLYAVLTAVFTSLVTILGKLGLKNIESNFGTMVRTIIVFVIIWSIVFFNKKHKEIKNINKKSWIFIILSGITTGLSWICYFKALQEGEASAVFPIEKLSIVVTAATSCLFLKEKMNFKTIVGLIIIVAGTFILII